MPVSHVTGMPSWLKQNLMKLRAAKQLESSSGGENVFSLN